MSIPPIPSPALLQTLQKRFLATAGLHPGLSWDEVEKKLYQAPEVVSALQQMEETGGEPCVVSDPAYPDTIVFMDCAAESPSGRRSLCYDREARQKRKTAPPKNSAQEMAASMGIRLLSEAQYRALQALGDFDLKTSSWIQTPDGIRSRGGALFCDKRYGQVFVYHNGADSYYASRGFRGFVTL